jgi:glycosyltransferase involved in cell wall biosynthesis
MAEKLIIVVPSYNEQVALPRTIEVLSQVLKDLAIKNKIAPDSKLMFVDDGSTDLTWKTIEDAANENVTGVKLSKNFGHQGALLAGLSAAGEEADI